MEDEPPADASEEPTVIWIRQHDSPNEGFSPLSGEKGPRTDAPSTTIGQYALTKVLGEGGFGEVWLAEQQMPVRRQVAVKILKFGLGGREALARFQQEFQALAVMDHSGIAKMLDAGACADGRPYFVMELVRGERITDFADNNRLSITERLGLFLQVCSAIQHAHQKGIIHRDIKPSNILVANQGSEPSVRVIDFGIAKAIEQPLTDMTLLTTDGQMMGTPSYMSPEQACSLGKRGDVDTRSDIYSLGVLLFELLTGHTPLDRNTLANSDFLEVLRLIREEETPRPSHALSRLPEDQRNLAASTRSTSASQLGAALRGELDWVVMRCLEKDRTRRYESVGALAAEVQHYLAGEPVEARPPSQTYLWKKRLKRHRAAVIAGMVVTASLIAGIVATSHYALEEFASRQEAEQQRKRAVQSRAQAEDLLQYLLGDLRHHMTGRLRLKVLKDLEAKVESYYEKLGVDQNDAPQFSRWAWSLRNQGETHLELGDVSGAEALFERYHDLCERLVNLQPENLEWRAKLADSHRCLGDAAVERGGVTAARAAFESMHTIMSALATKDPTDPKWQRELGVSTTLLGTAAQVDGDSAKALRLYKQAEATLAAVVEAHPVDSEAQNYLAAVRLKKGTMLRDLENLAEAEAALQLARDTNRKLVEQEPQNGHWLRDLANSWHQLGLVHLASGNLTAAEEDARESHNYHEQLVELDPQNTTWQRDFAGSLAQLCTIYVQKGDLTRAGENGRASRAVLERLVAQDRLNTHWQRDLAAAWVAAADLCDLASDLAGAEDAYLKALQIHQPLLAEAAVDIAWQRELAELWNRLGALRQQRGNLPGAHQALKSYQEIILRLAAQSPENRSHQRELAIVWNRLGDLRLLEQDLNGAEEAFGKALETVTSLTKADAANSDWKREQMVALNRIGDAQLAKGALASATTSFQTAQKLASELVAKDAQNVDWAENMANIWRRLGDLELAQMNSAAALGFFEKFRSGLQSLLNKDSTRQVWQRQWAVSQRKCAQVRPAGPEALQEAQASVEKLSALVLANSGQIRWKYDLALSRFSLAKILHAVNDSAGAIAECDRALQCFAELRDAGHLYPAWQPDLANAQAWRKTLALTPQPPR